MERPVAKELILCAERRNKLIDRLASQNRKLGVEDKVVDSDADLLCGLDQVERGLPGDDVAGGSYMSGVEFGCGKAVTVAMRLRRITVLQK